MYTVLKNAEFYADSKFIYIGFENCPEKLYNFWVLLFFASFSKFFFTLKLFQELFLEFVSIKFKPAQNTAIFYTCIDF